MYSLEDYLENMEDPSITIRLFLRIIRNVTHWMKGNNEIDYRLMITLQEHIIKFIIPE